MGLRNLFPRVRTLAYCEIENYCVANLVTKIEAGQMDAAPICTSLADFPFKSFRGVPNLIITGGFPCQPFSGASGKRRSTEDPRHLFPIILEGIRECNPSTVFLENVEGIISAKTGDGQPVLKYVLEDLERLGFRAEAGIFSASEVGARHQRKRVFILAHSNSAGLEGRNSQSLCQRPIKLSTWQRSPQVSRPNEQQHEWESRRTIPKSRLDRTTDGARSGVDSTAFRVDRLRMLGNGCYPDQVAFAYYTLNKRLCQNR
jgi:site-specific DNA-cytosine methylase